MISVSLLVFSAFSALLRASALGVVFKSVKIFYTDHFVLPLPPWHRFPMQKYALLRERVERARLGGEPLAVPAAATDEQLLHAHSRAYLERVKTGALSEQEQRRIGFPWSEQMVERSRRSSGATLAAARAALTDKVGVNLAGGTHHAFRDHGEGYCVFNDAVVAARSLQAEGLVERVAILDCDVHQGNGTASIVADDPSVYTFSVHAAGNYPFDKESSDLDIELADGADDETYLQAVERGVCTALSAAQPHLAIFLAGADPFEGDRLGRLKISKPGLAQRDALVLELCRGAHVPVAIAMAGGYARRIEDCVDIHFNTVLTAAEFAAH
jgi:acetoin utilization deacetylase AcuC-like enzyme